MNFRKETAYWLRNFPGFFENRQIFLEVPHPLADAAERTEKIVGSETQEVSLEEIKKREQSVWRELGELMKITPRSPQIRQVCDFFQNARNEFEKFQASEDAEIRAELKELGQSTVKELSRLESELQIEQRMSQKFRKLNSIFGLSEAGIQYHWEQYLALPQERRVPIPVIFQKINDVVQRFQFMRKMFPSSAKMQESSRRHNPVPSALALKVLGILLKGNSSQNFDSIEQIKTQIDNLIFVLAREKQSSLQEEWGQKMNVLSRIFGNVAAATHENGKLFDFWQPNLEDQIGEGVYQFSQVQERLRGLEQSLAALNPTLIQWLQVRIYEEYNALRKAKADPQKIKFYLLQVYDILGEQNLPEEMRNDVLRVVNVMKTDPNASAFERAYYGKNYAEALQIAIDQSSRNEWLHEAIETFEADEGKGARQKAAGRRDVLVIRFQRRASYENSLNRIYIERLQNGSLRISTDETSNNPVIPAEKIKTLRAPLQGDHWEITLSPKQLEQERGQREQNQRNIEQAIEKNPHLNYIRQAGQKLQGKILGLQQLFFAGIEGRKTEEFVKLARKCATDIKSELKKFPDLQAHLLEARKELIPLQGFMSGRMSDAHESFIEKTRADLNMITSLLDSEKISDLVDQILNSEFDPDNFVKWCKEDLIVIVTAIACGIAIISCVGTPLGITGLVGISSLGAVGYIGGAEIGTTFVNVSRDQPLRAQYARWLSGEINAPELLGGYVQDWAVFTTLSLATLGLLRQFKPSLPATSPLAILIEELEPVSLIYLIENRDNRATESILEQVYGIKFLPETGEYIYGRETEVQLPEGLAIYLEYNGFQIEGDLETGKFVASRGSEKIKFRMLKVGKDL